MEVLEDNVEAVEASKNKIEEDPNQQNAQIVKIVQRVEIDRHQGTKTKAPVQQISPRHMSSNQQEMSQLLENCTLCNKLPVTQGIGVGHKHVISIIGGNHDRISSKP